MQSRRRMFLFLALFTSALFGTARLVEASASWPNEPSGATLISDYNYNTVSADGWFSTGGDSSIISDPTAPLSPNNVLQMRYPIGFQAGIAPDNSYHSLNGAQRQVYAGFWWKANANWQQETNSAVSKIAFFVSNGAFDVFIGMQGPQGGPYALSVMFESPTLSNGHLPASYGDNPGTRVLLGNVSRPSVVPGNWYRVEMYSKHSTTSTSRDGIFRWWVNGVLCGDYTTVNFSDLPWVQFNLSPTWGGMNNTKRQTDYYWFDHIHLSLPSGGSSTAADQPPGAPAAPRILNVTVQ
jgi:hypothetical protein